MVNHIVNAFKIKSCYELQKNKTKNLNPKILSASLPTKQTQITLNPENKPLK